MFTLCGTNTVLIHFSSISPTCRMRRSCDNIESIAIPCTIREIPRHVDVLLLLGPCDRELTYGRWLRYHHTRRCRYRVQNYDDRNILKDNAARQHVPCDTIDWCDVIVQMLSASGMRCVTFIDERNVDHFDIIERLEDRDYSLSRVRRVRGTPIANS